MYCTVIKHDRNLRRRGNCRKHEPLASVFYIQSKEHSRNVEITRLWLVFSTFPSCSQMSVMFYRSVLHGLGFFICFRLCGKNKKKRFFSVLYSNKTWVFDQSECAQGPIYTIKVHKFHISLIIR